MSYKIDGVRIKLVQSDLDGDGNTNETESIQTHSNRGIINVKDTTEMGEVLEHMNSDNEDGLKLSSIDFNSRVNEYQLAPLIAVDSIASMGVISKKSRLIVKNTMRKSVSLGGKGREEVVELMSGKNERDAKKGQMSNLNGVKP